MKKDPQTYKYLEFYNGNSSSQKLSNYTQRDYANGAPHYFFSNVCHGILLPGTHSLQQPSAPYIRPCNFFAFGLWCLME